MNPLLKESVVARAYQADPTAADAEYGGQFREPVTAYLSRELIERAVEPGITERPPLPGVQYVAFVDCSSGAGTDSFACAIAHKARDKERDVVVIDTIIAQRPPFSPLDVIAALAEHLKRWRIHEVMGDGYGKPFISIFAKSGISYVTTPLDTSAIYLHALPAWTSNSVAMLANPLSPESTSEIKDVQAAAQTMGLQLKIFNASTLNELSTAFTAIAELRPDALLVASDPFFLLRREELTVLAARIGAPAIYPFREFAPSGGLISYGTNIASTYRQAGIYTGRILRGAKPAELPIMLPTQFWMVINLKTAKTLGLDVRTTLLARADEVIE